MTRFVEGMLSVGLMILGVGVASGQDYPNKPIRFIAPFPPGGSSDLIARVLSQRMSEQLGQPVVIDNRPGASGSLGTELGAKAPADGYTLLLGSVSNMAINPHLLARVGYDPRKDFAVVSALARGPELPTMLEAGVPGFVSESWWGAFDPTGTPTPIVRRLADVVARILPEAETKERFAALGIETLILPNKEFTAMVRSELAHYCKIVKAVGIANQ